MYGVCRKMRNAAEMPAAERMSSKSPYDGTDRIRFDGCNLSLRPLQREAPLFSFRKYKNIFFKKRIRLPINSRILFLKSLNTS